MRILIPVIAIVLFPFTALASCSSSGATVVYVNGILTAHSDAQKDLGKLQVEYIKGTGDYSLIFTNGYNASHLVGAGDLAQVAAQMLDSSIGYYQHAVLVGIT